MIDLQGWIMGLSWAKVPKPNPGMGCYVDRKFHVKPAIVPEC